MGYVAILVLYLLKRLIRYAFSHRFFRAGYESFWEILERCRSNSFTTNSGVVEIDIKVGQTCKGIRFAPELDKRSASTLEL